MTFTHGCHGGRWAGIRTFIANYHGSLAEDLAALKFGRRRRTGTWLLKRGIDYYRLYKEFLTAQKVDAFVDVRH